MNLVSPIQIMSCLRFIVFVVSCLHWLLHNVDMHIFHNISRPLNCNAIKPDIGDDALEKFKLQYMPVTDYTVSLPLSCLCINDCLLVDVKIMKSGFNLHTGILIDDWCLSKVAEIKE
jgi:hypothetical protein